MRTKCTKGIYLNTIENIVGNQNIGHVNTAFGQVTGRFILGKGSSMSIPPLQTGTDRFENTNLEKTDASRDFFFPTSSIDVRIVPTFNFKTRANFPFVDIHKHFRSNRYSAVLKSKYSHRTRRY